MIFGRKKDKQDSEGNSEGFFKRLRSRLNRGDSWLTYDLANLAPGGKIDESTFEELESLLVMADVGIDTSQRIVTELEKSLSRSDRKDVEALKAGLRSALLSILEPVAQPLEIPQQ